MIRIIIIQELVLKLLITLSQVVLATIDLNRAELQYLADHLLPEECRRLVAAAHFKSDSLPNILAQAGICTSVMFAL